ncbi:hypothetical protein GBAR_LOCUS19125 [Geodia barretti]|uniref:Uncharacterized protein n=1 Tax=Geodia barretti TaxID=519541 RepID=A0AA35SQQ6_GEOBA|nr:hypothetical protein GBAR_LOCUS19125 [Geodia barretti]
MAIECFQVSREDCATSSHLEGPALVPDCEGFGIGSEKVEKVKDGDEAGDIFTFPKTPNDRAEPPSYIYWMTVFSGVGAVVAGLLHAAFWKPFSMIFGAIVSYQYRVIDHTTKNT